MCALKIKEEKYQFVGMNLTDIPEWFTKMNGGKHPVIEAKDGKLYSDMTQITKFLEDLPKGRSLYPEDTTEKYKVDDLVDELFPECMKVNRILFGAAERASDGPAILSQSFEFLEEKLGDSYPPYFYGTSLTYADIVVLPFVHMAFMTEDTCFKNTIYNKFNMENLEKLKNWHDALALQFKDCLGDQKDFKDVCKKLNDGEYKQLYYPMNSTK